MPSNDYNIGRKFPITESTAYFDLERDLGIRPEVWAELTTSVKLDFVQEYALAHFGYPESFYFEDLSEEECYRQINETCL